jgi:hypothetical protein
MGRDHCGGAPVGCGSHDACLLLNSNAYGLFALNGMLTDVVIIFSFFLSVQCSAFLFLWRNFRLCDATKARPAAFLASD